MVADRFLGARRAAKPLYFYPGEFPQSLDEAYTIQDRAIAGWHKPVFGWKVGRIGEPFSRQYGAERLAGPIFDVTVANDGDVPLLPVFDNGFAAAEAEFLLRLGQVPAPGKKRFELDEVAELIDAVHVGIEIASSPLAAINELGPVAIVSDFGNNNGLLVGPPIQNWRESGFEDWEVTTLIDGAEVGKGCAASFVDGAIGSARFLLELLARRGIAIQPGQWISSGAVSGVHEARAGQSIEARFGDDGIVTCSLFAAQPE
jgi:2-keto-4-pentenoate hydratase